MNPGLPEEAGQTARSVIDALKVQPAMLGLLVLNIIFIGVVGYLTYANAERRDALVIRKEDEVIALTNKCIDLAIKVQPPKGYDGGDGQH